MSNHLDTYDLLVIGGGLSGTRVIIELISNITKYGWSCSAPPLRIAIIDRIAAFGGGIPYGWPSAPGFLLIESAEMSTPNAFLNWLAFNRTELIRYASTGTEYMRCWLKANETDLVTGNLGRLFVPRSFFGKFVRAELKTAVESSISSGYVSIDMLKAEAIDIVVHADRKLEVTLADGSNLFSRLLVLAIGSIPRSDSYGLTDRDGYIADPYRDAYRGLRKAIHCGHASRKGPVDVIIAGSNASAMETIYYFAHSSDLKGMIRSVAVISGSGSLPKGSSADGLRPSPPEYVQSAIAFGEEGKLDMQSGQVVGVTRAGPGLQVNIQPSDSKPRSLTADIVVNCTGAGRIDNSGSMLLNTLVHGRQDFSCNRLGRGFELRPNTYEIDGVDNCFVIGPLLNGDNIADHIESIEAVYRVANELALALYNTFCRQATYISP
jgi:uncharacterized NAD(P)/FAD-binding protein YdhS